MYEAESTIRERRKGLSYFLEGGRGSEKGAERRAGWSQERW